MSLIKCPECGKDNVSNSANACPNCGFNIAQYYKKDVSQTPLKTTNTISSQKTRKAMWFLVVLFIATTIVSGGIWMKSRTKIKSYNSQIEEKQKSLGITKALITNPNGDGYKYYDSYNKKYEELEELNDSKEEQKKINLATAICFLISSALLILCLILL